MPATRALSTILKPHIAPHHSNGRRRCTWGIWRTKTHKLQGHPPLTTSNNRDAVLRFAHYLYRNAANASD